MRRPLFITATSTGIGKSVVTACILNALIRDGHKVFPFKPVQSGCLKTVDDLNANDALLLKHASSCEAPIQEINPYSFRQPVSPHFAARQEEALIDMTHLCGLVKSKLENHFVLIEGAGGIATPMADGLSNADFARSVNAVVLIVTTPFLGTINHTLLTLEFLHAKKLENVGMIVNRWPANPSAAEFESVNYISKAGYSPVLGYIEEIKNLDLNDSRHMTKLFDAFYSEAADYGLMDDIISAMSNPQ